MNIILDKDKVVKGIESITQKAGKTYSFQEEHNPKLPADYWFQYPPEGLTLFIVFYTQACRWAKCLGCNLPSKMSKFHIDFSNIMYQVDFIFDFLLSSEQKNELRKIIISNNGSVLDEVTFSTTALLYFFAKMNQNCPNVSVVSIESRPEYVDFAELEVISRALKEGKTPTQLEIAIGFEAFDNKIRNEYFNKGLTLEKFIEFVELVAKYKFKLKTYFMQKPVPEMTEEDAIDDIVDAINYINDIAIKYDLDINIHLNPTYVAKGTILEEKFNQGLYTPPLLESVRKAVLSGENKKISIFVGLYDEGLSVPGGSFIRKGDELLLEKFELFNKTQDFNVIKSL